MKHWQSLGSLIKSLSPLPLKTLAFVDVSLRDVDGVLGLTTCSRSPPPGR
jgi:hypothetical protein